jgi:hypothetical protein
MTAVVAGVSAVAQPGDRANGKRFFHPPVLTPAASAWLVRRA